MLVSQNCVVLSMVLLMNSNRAICIAVSNAKFNASLRDFSVNEDETNSTTVRTLQNESFARYASFAPLRKPIKFKEIPDNALSSSSHHGRGLHHEQHGYGLLDYDDNPHYVHSYGYHLDPHDLHDYHHDDHGHHDYHDLHHYPHHGGHGYHHKHVAHTLAAKTILWPIAGIALLGAAAALVTNPVLLQLGVVSGRRKRRETNKDTTDSDSLIDWLKTDPVKYLTKTQIIEREASSINKKDDNLDDKPAKYLKKDALIDRILSVNKQKNWPRKVTVVRKNADSDVLRNKSDEDKHFIPVLLKTNNG